MKTRTGYFHPLLYAQLASEPPPWAGKSSISANETLKCDPKASTWRPRSQLFWRSAAPCGLSEPTFAVSLPIEHDFATSLQPQSKGMRWPRPIDLVGTASDKKPQLKRHIHLLQRSPIVKELRTKQAR